jgi:hypothetical protein
MAISMGAALLGSAVIGGVGSAISGSKNSKAIKNATAAQTAANDKAVALQQEARNQNVGFQQPFYQTGLAANNRINALLGLSVPQQQQFGQPSIMGQYNTPGFGSGTPMGGRQGYPTDFRFNENPMLGDYGYQPDVYGYQQTTAMPQTNALADAQQGFGDWRNNTGYQFRFNEGIRAIDAGAPIRNSGATLKARQQYGQNIGSQEFYNYLGALTGQQQVGTGAANALSGVNTTYANNASQIAQTQGQNLANSAVARANNSNNTLNGITSSFSNVLGMFGGRM